MSDMRCETVLSDLRGEEALASLPKGGQAPSELLIHAGGLKRIDAWGAVALRTSVEFYARAQSQQVMIMPPSDPETWRLLFCLLERDTPKRFILSDDAELPSNTTPPRSIIFPAIGVATVHQAEQIAEAIIDTASGKLGRPLRYVAGQLPGIVENSLTHARASITRPVLCVFYDRHEDEVQLVVSDLGATYDRAPSAAADALAAAVFKQPDGGLTSAVEVAASRGIDATLTLAAGSGRLYWRSGTWTKATAQSVSGFTAALTVPIED